MAAEASTVYYETEQDHRVVDPYDWLQRDDPEMLERAQVLLAEITHLLSGEFEDLTDMEMIFIGGVSCVEFIHNDVVRKLEGVSKAVLTSESLIGPEGKNPDQYPLACDILRLRSANGKSLSFTDTVDAIRQAHGYIDKGEVFVEQTRALSWVAAFLDNDVESQADIPSVIAAESPEKDSDKSATDTSPEPIEPKEIVTIPRRKTFKSTNKTTHPKSNRRRQQSPRTPPSRNTTSRTVYGVSAKKPSVVLPWGEKAKCTQADPEVFFPEKGGSTREAKRICASCDVRAGCLEYALSNDERFGIWGGMSERERRRLKRMAS